MKNIELIVLNFLVVLLRRNLLLSDNFINNLKIANRGICFRDPGIVQKYTILVCKSTISSLLQLNEITFYNFNGLNLKIILISRWEVKIF